MFSVDDMRNTVVYSLSLYKQFRAVLGMDILQKLSQRNCAFRRVVAKHLPPLRRQRDHVGLAIHFPCTRIGIFKREQPAFFDPLQFGGIIPLVLHQQQREFFLELVVAHQDQKKRKCRDKKRRTVEGNGQKAEIDDFGTAYINDSAHVEQRKKHKSD